MHGNHDLLQSTLRDQMAGIRDFVINQARQYEVEGSGLQPITSAIARSMDAYQNFENESRKIADDANLSPKGKREKIQKFVAEHAHELVRVRTTVEAAKIRMSERRVKLQPPPIDKSDAAGAVMRAQIRDRFIAMSNGERKAALPNVENALYLQAILEAPNELLGITNEQREMVMSKAIEIANPGSLARLEADGEAVSLLEVASRVLSEIACEVTDLPNAAALDDFVNTAVPDQRHIEADAIRNTAPLAA
jgi:hypothetical protein